jgi:hypothetical protein
MVVLHQLQRLSPPADPHVPSSPIFFTYTTLASSSRGYLRLFSRENTYRISRAEDLGAKGLQMLLLKGARRRRRSGGPGGRCARKPVGTYIYIYAVGASNHVAVPGLARLGPKRGIGSCDPRDQQLLGSNAWSFWKS